VGVQLSHTSHVWGEHAIEFLGVGTAVRTLGDTEPMPAPTLPALAVRRRAKLPART
jgi:hypothetical protein